jgi:hypothetical protein
MRHGVDEQVSLGADGQGMKKARPLQNHDVPLGFGANRSQHHPENMVSASLMPFAVGFYRPALIGTR